MGLEARSSTSLRSAATISGTPSSLTPWVECQVGNTGSVLRAQELPTTPTRSPEVLKHPDAAVLGEQAEVERVGEHEQAPRPLRAPGVVDGEGAVQRGLPSRREAAAVPVKDRLHGRVRQEGDADEGEAGRRQLRDAGHGQVDRRGRVEEEVLAAVHPEAPPGERVVAGGGLEEGVDGGEGDVDGGPLSGPCICAATKSEEELASATIGNGHDHPVPLRPIGWSRIVDIKFLS